MKKFELIEGFSLEGVTHGLFQGAVGSTYRVKRRKGETTSEKHEIGMMGTNAEREQGVKPGKNK